MNQPKASVKLELLVRRKVHFFKRTLVIFFSMIGKYVKWKENCYHVAVLLMLPTCLNTYGGWPRVRVAVIADGTYKQTSTFFASCTNEG